MLQDYFYYGLLCALAIALLFAAFTDLKSRRIANWLNGAIALAAPLFWIASGLDLWPGVAIQFGVAIATFAICAGMFAIGWMGGGDVKLLVALALWIPPAAFLKLLVIMALAGGVLTVILGGWHVIRRRKDRITIPYGVAIAFGGLWVISTDELARAGAQTLIG